MAQPASGSREPDPAPQPAAAPQDERDEWRDYEPGGASTSRNEAENAEEPPRVEEIVERMAADLPRSGTENLSEAETQPAHEEIVDPTQAVAQAMQRGVATIAGASTGNAASSLAGLCSALGTQVVIFVPASAPAAKLAQLRTYGALVVAVEGSYDQAFDLCLAATQRFGWYSRNTAYNPVLSEGKKTVSFEILEQRRWRAPDWIAVPVGDGCILGGVAKGLRDLQAVGLMDRMPRLLGVQATGSAALYNAWKAGSKEVAPVEPDTVADSIAVGQPRDAVKALRGIADTDGAFVVVEDEAILEAGHQLGYRAGVFAEPAASAALAGTVAAKEQGLIGAADEVVVLATGNGLKDPLTSSQGTPAPVSVAPGESSLDAVHDALSAR